MKLKEIRVDGYKNLINCRVPLGDFNVMVGPNNSGKSNFLDTLMVLKIFCFGDDELEERIFLAGYATRYVGSPICHLKEYKNRPLKIGLKLELNINKKVWVAEYDVTIKYSEQQSKMVFVEETLKGKEPTKTGAAKTYINRNNKDLYVLGKKHKISPKSSIFEVVDALYPDYAGLPEEITALVVGILHTMRTTILAISPDDLRKEVDDERAFHGWRTSAYNVLR
ncbi:AAA family ATPase, partial [Planctomycetota bacterium]